MTERKEAFLVLDIAKTRPNLFLVEVVVQKEGPRPFRLQLVLDHLCAADLLPLSVSAVLDVQEADGIRAGKVVQFADAPGKKEGKE